MAKFRFRLETLHRLREMNRDELRVRLAEAIQAEQIVGAQRQELLREAAALAAARREQFAAGSPDISRVLNAQRYQLMLEAQERALAEQAQKLAEEIEVRRLAVVEADRQVRVLDKLRERRAAQHAATQNAADAKRLDEIATTRWETNRR
jgi:flagellar FliJ protein